MHRDEVGKKPANALFFAGRKEVQFSPINGKYFNPLSLYLSLYLWIWMHGKDLHHESGVGSSPIRV